MQAVTLFVRGITALVGKGAEQAQKIVGKLQPRYAVAFKINQFCSKRKHLRLMREISIAIHVHHRWRQSQCFQRQTTFRGPHWVWTNCINRIKTILRALNTQKHNYSTIFQAIRLGGFSFSSSICLWHMHLLSRDRDFSPGFSTKL